MNFPKGELLMLGQLQPNPESPVIKNDAKVRFLHLLLYGVILAVPGYFINRLPFPGDPFNGAKDFIWFSYFMIVTFGFAPTRRLITPLFNFKAMKDPKSYLFIFATFLIPYTLFRFCIHFEVLLDIYYIYDFKYNMLTASSLASTIGTALLTPITEEILFRGILLTVLLRLLKPFWAISMTAVLFGIIHPSEAWLFTFMAGFLLTFTAYKTKSLIPAIAAHSLWNLYHTQLFLYF
jgi:membrane protease YdiL (CAAX protease family)